MKINSSQLQVILFKKTSNPIRFNLNILFIKFFFVFVISFLIAFAFLFSEFLNLKSELSDNKELIYSLENSISIKDKTISKISGNLHERNNIIEKELIFIEEKLQEVDNYKSLIIEEAGIGQGGFQNSSPITENSPLQIYISDSSIEEFDNKSLNILLSIEKDFKDYEMISDQIEERNKYISSFPDLWPTKGYISSYFGNRINPITYQKEFHNGIDIANSYNTPIYSAAKGRVAEINYHYLFGKYILIDHDFGFKTLYAHLSSTNVKVGDDVEKGSLIAKMGSSGQSTGPHLHFEIIKDGINLNPNKIEDYFGKE
jgi:murein DD-endopeptidase MepM/ murein hydrolase activator NlpD